MNINPKQSVNRMPSQERVRSLFDYNVIDGNLIWRTRPVTDFSRNNVCGTWNTKSSGKIAGNVRSDGYVVISIDGARYLAHRLVWVFHNGDIGELSIDHINHKRSDNRIENLRVVTRAENQRNQSMPKTNKSGHVGVHWHRAIAKWQVSIRVDGKIKNIGYYNDIDEAISARSAASAEHGYHQNHGRKLQGTQ